MSVSGLVRLARSRVCRLVEFGVGTVVIYRHTRIVDVPCEARIEVAPTEALGEALQMDSPAQVEMLRKRASRGDIVYRACLGGRMMHRGCLQPGPGIARCEHRVAFPLRRGEAYIHSCRTHADGRGRGMYPATLSRMAQDWKARGSDVYVATVESNLASMRGIEKAGYSMTRRVRSLVLFGIGVWQRELGVPG